jgi:hypothetical protein
MAYVTSNPPILISQGIGGVGKTFFYASTDAQTDVDAAGYFTDGWDRGMRAQDHVIGVDTDASPIASWIQMVNAATSTSVDLNNGVAITATDSD